MSDTFTCASCHETFEKEWGDEEAAAEADQLFGEIADPVTVCDDCWQIIMRRAGADQA